jgi:hypothetical protein
MRLEGTTPGFKTFECPKCAFFVIEVNKDSSPSAKL